jgi:hypothetical protein
MKTNSIKVFLLVQLLVSYAFADGYPKSRLEKEIDEMGSLAGEEGIVFRPSKVKNDSTKSTVSNFGKINKYLYQASLDVLNLAPLASADSAGGVIITDWYSTANSPNVQFKVNVFIKDDVISTEAIEVKAFERSRRNGKWSEDYKKSPISIVLEDKILRRARELYISSSKRR